MSSQWWYASDKFADGNFSSLGSTTSGGGLSEKERTIPDATKLTIRVEGTWVRDDVDGGLKGDNDLVVVTRHKVGTRPQVDRLHFLKEEVPEREWLNFVWHPVVFATDDFRVDDEEVKLHVRVYDEDGLSESESAAINTALTTAASAAAVAFPVFAPFAGLSSGVGSALINLVDELDQHDEIIDGAIALAINKPPNKAYDLLLPGFYVVFGKPVDAAGLLLGQDRKLYTKPSGKDADLYTHTSYTVLRVEKRLAPTNYSTIDERAATLLSEIENGKKNRKTEALRFVRETLTAYTNFRRLERYVELKGKDSLTDEERALLDELLSDAQLAPFLPSGS